MDKTNRDYEVIIEKQREELSRYKKRLTDLINAYKCLTKEKEALEVSLKALNQASLDVSQDDSSTEPSEDSQASKSEDSEQLKAQLNTLMNSLAVLSEEKSRMEASFQVDKKQLRAEKQQLESTIKELNERLEHETRAHLSEMENFKSKLIIERHQREKEHNDHGVMIRELQKVMSEERGRREKAEGDADSARTKLSEAEERLASMDRGWSETKAKLEQAMDQLEVAKRGSGDIASKLRSELAALKAELSNSTSKERIKAAEAEERARNLAEFHEERVANLESRLAELSLIVGNYDRLRQSDQIAIDKLKERLAQLELEHCEEKGDLSVDNLLSRMKSIRDLLELANLSSEKPVDIKEILMEVFQISCEKEVHESCRTEYNQLKHEFDIYKQKNLVSNASNFRMEPNNEIESCKSQIRGLKEKIRNLHDQIEQNEIEHKKEVESVKQNSASERSKLKEKFESCEKKWREEVEMLENQLTKQRERAMALVKEKDQEINEIKMTFSHLIPQRHSTDATPGVGISEKEDLCSSSVVSGGMLHFSQEVARKDVELSRLRRDKLSLEAELRHLRLRFDEAMRKEIELHTALKHQTERLNRIQSQDGANLEYLKNVVFSFLMSDDSSCKSHMLNAIATVLKFTDAERNNIKQQSWWFNKVSIT